MNKPANPYCVLLLACLLSLLSGGLAAASEVPVCKASAAPLPSARSYPIGAFSLSADYEKPSADYGSGSADLCELPATREESNGSRTSGSADYDIRWQRVEKALADDLPATALKELTAIRQRAAREGDMPQLCRALFQSLHCSVEISPDSLQPSLDAIRQALDAEQRPVQRAVYQHVLGLCQNDTALLRASFADLPLLAEARAADYLPLIETGADSRWLYADDLLSLFLSDVAAPSYAAVIREAQSLYARQGRTAASLLLAERLNLPDSILYPLWRNAVDADASLRRISPIMNYLAGVEQATLSIDCLTAGLLRPGQKATFVAHARNLRQATFTFAGQTHTLRFADTPAWQTRTDTLTLTAPKAGSYEACLAAAGLSDTENVQISSVKPLFFGLPDGRCRLAIVDAATGRMLPQPSLVRKARKSKATVTFKPEADGFIYLSRADFNPSGQTCDFYPRAGSDTYHPALASWNFSAGYYNEGRPISETLAHIATDRNIYRPGQQVQVAVMAYRRADDDYRAAAGQRLVLRLVDSNRRDVASDTLTTDTLGTAAATFALPSVCLPGSFCICAEGDEGIGARQYIRVEEYKRPTFLLKTDGFIGTFSLGDTVVVRGRAVTYSGVPLADTPVTTDQGDTLTTDADGRFAFPVEVKRQKAMPWFWGRQSLTLKAVAANGETAEATVHWSIRTDPKESENKSADSFSYSADSSHKSADRKTLPYWEKISCSADGSEAVVSIGSCHRPVWAFLDVVSSSRVIEQRIVEFTDSFRHTLRYRPEWGDGAVLHLAFVKEGELHEARAEVVRPRPDKRLLLRWETFRSDLQPGAREEWMLSVRHPDGSPAQALVTARLYDAALDAFTANDWGFSLDFRRNLPSAYWHTASWDFPSQYLSAKLPAYKPLSLTRWRSGLFAYVGADLFSPRRLYANRRLKGVADLEEAALAGGPLTKAMATAPTAMANGAMAAKDEAADIEGQRAESADETVGSVRENFDETAFFMPALRSDAEGRVALRFTLPESLTTWHFTALAHDAALNYGFLRDTIVARKQLMAEISAPRFLRHGDRTEIPVTLTNLTPAAQACRLAFSIGDSTATHTLTLAPNERRTLTFPYTVEAEAGGWATLRVRLASDEFADGEERLVPLLSNLVELTRSVPYSLVKPGRRTLDLTPLWQELPYARRATFTTEQTANPAWYVAEALTPMLQARAESASSWAERLYALKTAQYVRTYLPDFKDTDNCRKESENCRRDSANCRRTTENCRRTNFEAPAEGADSGSDSPFDRNADLRQTLLEETPWLLRAYSEAERRNRMAELLEPTALSVYATWATDELTRLQTGTGAWSWYKGMEDSPWITLEVCTLLARLQVLTGKDDRLAALLDKALPYLKGVVHRDVQEMKREEKRHGVKYGLSDRHCRFLYLCALLSQPKNADMAYLLEKLQKANHELSMYGKAGAAVILAAYGQEKRANLLLRSLLEHTVVSEEMGRSFDTDRALSGWYAYKIPTQTFAVEALQRLKPEEEREALQQMRLWLLQSKRTQQWMSSEATADAIYAVMTDTPGGLRPTEAGAGYTRHTETDAARMGQPSLTVENTDGGLLWGAAYVQYLLPADKAVATQSGLTLTRRLEVERPEGWVETDRLRVGDRIRLSYTLRAERDMDFVSVRAQRAACMEPRRPLSGYDWLTRAYRAVRDQRSDFSFEHLAKGTHTFTEEMTLQRAGRFSLGVASAECVYAPEYRASTANQTIEVLPQ